jgi:transcriptional regulator with XRE-family HTH domain
LRERRRLSQESLADLAKIERSYMSVVTLANAPGLKLSV